ncbi:hypothetical protein Y09_0442 [Brachybacterium sp. SW0106-09]|nr:hypothetical protein Y09_0442 [Brachybacterium sp. SW0106-09]
MSRRRRHGFHPMPRGRRAGGAAGSVGRPGRRGRRGSRVDGADGSTGRRAPATGGAAAVRSDRGAGGSLSRARPR